MKNLKTYWTGSDLDSPSFEHVPNEANRIGIVVGDIEMEYCLLSESLTIRDSVDLDEFIKIDCRPIRLLLDSSQ